MNNINIKLHDYQKQILAKLSNNLALRFNELILEGLESEHMNYHLKKLIDFELVGKTGENYQLTDKGKDYSNMMDDQVEFIEKQPKLSVLLHIVRKNDKGELELLLSKRLRHPYFGKVGRLTGKIRFGETVRQAAERELYEETGLKAETIILEQVYHKMRFNEEGEYLQDNVFFKFFIKDIYGQFIENTGNQQNLWLGKEDFKLKDKYDFFENVEFEDRYEPNQFVFEESNSLAKDY